MPAFKVDTTTKDQRREALKHFSHDSIRATDQQEEGRMMMMTRSTIMMKTLLRYHESFSSHRAHLCETARCSS